MTTRFLILMGLLTTAAQAGPITSYSIITDTADCGGHRATSAIYTNDGGAGGVGGLSTVAGPVEFAKSGYVGQLYDVTALSVTAPSSPAAVNGGATLQLAASKMLDDASYLGVATTFVAWSVTAGPISGISSAGLATASPVYQNTPATVQGVYGGFAGSLSITVTDLNNDSFGIYAGDGIPDSWQVQYFGLGSGGLGNPLGSASADADGTGETNLFKYIAGLNPIDPTSRFTVTVAPKPGQPGAMNLIFGPIAAGRSYTIMATSNLSMRGSWNAINVSAPTDNGAQRTITDLGASGPEKFYEVKISFP